MAKHGQAKPKKAPGTAVDARRGERAVLTEPGEPIDPPEHIGDLALSVWAEYWSDPVSSIVTEADHNLLRRWIDAVDRYWRLMYEADREPLTHSSTNNVTSNPLYKVALAQETAIQRMEAKLGIGPRNRANLGIAVLNFKEQEQKAKKREVSAAYDDPEDDPRVQS